MMNERRKSDRPIVPSQRPNKAVEAVAEGVEGRGLAKGNPNPQNMSRTQSRRNVNKARERIREAAPAPRRHDPRQEPSALNALAGICAGGPG